MTIEQSTVLDERYRLEERIGTGGMADVFRATDTLLNRQVAVKVLREVDDVSARERFVHEARTLAGLNHPGLIILLDAGILGARPYLVLTLADDDTLATRISEGPMQPAAVKVIGAQVARALAYAHEQGVVHRDVKPSNVLLSSDGRALLADFGIARLIGSTEQYTKTGDAIGSPAYLAPEQVAGEEMTPAVDVYSLGLVLLEALTAERAFIGSPVEAAMARLNAAPPMPTELDPGWRALIARMTHRIPEDRPSAAEVVEELEATELPADAAPLAAPADDLEATGELAITMEGPMHSAGPVEQEAAYRVDTLPPPQRSWHRGWLLVAGLLVALAVVGAVVLSRSGGTNSNDSDTGVPDGVPAKYEQPLSDLHDALNGPAR